MKAAVYDKAGRPGVLRYLDGPDPVVRSEDVLIAVQAISVEGGDLMSRRLRTPPGPSWTIGFAAAGVIRAVGSCVESRKVGDRVAALHSHGSHAELWAVPATRTWLIPGEVHVNEACALPVSFGTANHCLLVRGGLVRNETVLVEAATGGLGLAAVQLAALTGAHVIAVASGMKRCDRLRSLGAYHVIDRAGCDVVSEVMRITGGRGVDVALDPVGSALPSSMAALAPEGRLIFTGNAGGGGMEVDLCTAMRSNHTLLGVFMGTLFERPSVWSMVERLFQQLAERHIQVVIDRTFPLSDASLAHEYAETAGPFGRVLIRPGETRH